MALRGIEEYIPRDANNIARVSPEKEPSNIIIIIIHIGLCVSSYYLTILSDCDCYSVCLQTGRKKARADFACDVIVIPTQKKLPQCLFV